MEQGPRGGCRSCTGHGTGSRRTLTDILHTNVHGDPKARDASGDVSADRARACGGAEFASRSLGATTAQDIAYEYTISGRGKPEGKRDSGERGEGQDELHLFRTLIARVPLRMDGYAVN